MNNITKIGYIFFFWTIFTVVKSFTLLFNILPIKYIVKFLNQKNNRILYLDVFFTENAGTNYRIKKWAEIIENRGTKVVSKNVYNKHTYSALLNNEKTNIKFHIGFIVIRLIHFIYALSFKTVIVRRTILLYNEYGQGTFMEILLNTIHPNVILDFDDDMAIQNNEASPLYGKLLLENKNKFYSNLNNYERFIVGSEYLKTLVLKHNNRVRVNNILVIPTCVDYDKYPTKKYVDTEIITFGWIGSSSNLIYLDGIIEALNSVAKNHKIKLLVISGDEYKNTKALFEIENKIWSLEDEVENLLKIDIGLMPLFNTDMEKGKCGFKLIQYMGLGIVSVGSAITVNKEIIDDGINGFLVHNPSDWGDVFKKVVDKKGEFDKIGEEARKKTALKYSFNQSISSNYFNFVTSYFCNNSFKDEARKVFQTLAYYGYYIFIKSTQEKTRTNVNLKPGITAVVSAKNEEIIISLSLQSLLGFADQIVCIDNGSDDKTLDLMHEFKSKYNNICDIEILSMPNALLGDCREAGLGRSKHQWHLRWDADMIFKTTGTESSKNLREKILKTNKALAFQLVRTNLFGDFHHTTKIYDVIDNGEPFLVRLSKKIKYVEHGRFDIIKLPIYYKTVKISDRYIFHCDGIKPNLRLVYRNCYFDWRQKLNSVENSKKSDYSDFKKFEKEWQLRRYKTNERNALIFRHQKETLPHLKKYDTEIYGEYPDIILDHIRSGKERFEILYKNGKPYLRKDSNDLSIENYISTQDDLAFNPLDYLREVLPESYIYKLV